MPALRIESVGYHHAAVLADLHAEAFSGGEIWSTGAIEALLDTPGTDVLLALDAGVPVGCVMIRRLYDEAEILTLAVVPAARRRRVAWRLLETAIGSLAGQGVARLFLEVSNRNPAAQGLYAALGFQCCGTRRNYYADGADALVLAADLRTSNR